ncbi:hypothetical protein [Sphingomonas carotinifaciens]|uniref:hypothetical protein n=1 Tax=Sphingomonas carotinifaciens TaxID=1166323 RepID=UPI0019684B44|nr:hypothetical protein [Sphingomonas carotinifaciens]
MSAIGDTQRLRWSLFCHEWLVDRWDAFAMDSLSDAHFQSAFNASLIPTYSIENDLAGL